jgi:hypothetical protein
MTNTIKMRPTGGTIDIVHNGQHFAQDLDGNFSIPADVAPELMRLHVGLEVAPAPAEKLAFNPVFNFDGGVTLANDVNGRLMALELAHFGQLNLFGELPFIDSNGQRVTLNAGEARALSGEYRTRLLASI